MDRRREKKKDGKFFMERQEEDEKNYFSSQECWTRGLKKLLSGEARNKLKKNCEMIENLKTNSGDSNHSRIYKSLMKDSFVAYVTWLVGGMFIIYNFTSLYQQLRVYVGWQLRSNFINRCKKCTDLLMGKSCLSSWVMGN